MKRFFVFFVSAAALISSISCAADTVKLGYNTGEVIAAETSLVEVDVFDREKSPYPHSFAKPRYVIVVLQMHPRRSISSVDYSLSLNGNTYNCIAAACNMEPFVCNPAVLYPENKDRVRLLFILDGSQTLSGSTISAGLKANLASRRDVQFNITDLGSGKFTDSGKIPAAGILK